MFNSLCRAIVSAQRLLYTENLPGTDTRTLPSASPAARYSTPMKPLSMINLMSSARSSRSGAVTPNFTTPQV